MLPFNLFVLVVEGELSIPLKYHFGDFLPSLSDVLDQKVKDRIHPELMGWFLAYWA